MTSRTIVYIGNYTSGDDAAIYRGEIDPASGALNILGTTRCEGHPSYLSLRPDGRYLYAVHEVNSYDGGGAVSAFAIDPDSGVLTFLNSQPTVGSPCHNTVDATRSFVLTTNYGGSSWCVHPIGRDGTLGEMTDFRRHEGSGENAERQGEPHPHSVNLDAANRFALVVDLGTDQVVVYEFDPREGKLRDHGATSVSPGAGPRHLAFHPSGRFAYVINELSNTLTAFTYDAGAGVLEEIDEVSTLPADFTGVSYTSAVKLSADGRFIYGSNRGHDSIATFSVGDDGHPSLIGLAAVPKEPRDFAIEPSGRFLYSGGHRTDVVTVLGIDAESGLLHATGERTEMPSPVCFRFLEID